MPSSSSDPSRETDGVSIAALVTGILGLALVAVGLGIAGLVRIQRSGRSGKGFAVAGIVLGAFATVVWSVIAVFFLFFMTAGTAEFEGEVQRGITEGLDKSYSQPDTAGTTPGR